MKLAFSSNAFGKYSLVDTIGILAGIGYEGIEIMADIPHAYPADLTEGDVEAIRCALDTHRLSVSNINGFMLKALGDFHHPSWIEADPNLRRRRVEHTLGCIDLAGKLGVGLLSTEPGGPLSGMTPEEGYRLFREGLSTIHERAKEKKIKVLIEPEPELLIENSLQFRRFYDRLDPEVFGLNFDIGHFFCVGEDPASLVKELKDSICHFHVEDIAPSRKHFHLMPGEGAIDLRGVFDAIEGIGYQGFVTVELYTYEAHPAEAAEKAFAYLHPLVGN